MRESHDFLNLHLLLALAQERLIYTGLNPKP